MVIMSDPIKVRTKPVVVDAIQWLGASISFDKVTEFMGGKHLRVMGSQLVVNTLDGDMLVSIGDYIIKGVRGEFYPCRKEIFEKNYEVV